MRSVVTNSRQNLPDVIWSIVDELKKKKVAAIYLFGSQAKGIARQNSDIDICVITEKGISRALKEEIMSNSSKSIDISLFWDLPPLIRFRVFREGKPLYIKDELALHRVKVNTLNSYLDIQPIVRRYCDKVLKRSCNV